MRSRQNRERPAGLPPVLTGHLIQNRGPEARPARLAQKRRKTAPCKPWSMLCSDTSASLLQRNGRACGRAIPGRWRAQ